MDLLDSDLYWILGILVSVSPLILIFFLSTKPIKK